MILRRLGPCTVRIWPEREYLETVLPSGHTVKAAPEDTDEYRARAEALGYPSPWAMCVAHEITHSLLAIAQGLCWSPVLHSVATGLPMAEEALWQEEARVMALQAWMNGLEPDRATLEPLAWALLERFKTDALVELRKVA